tara:strand:- start:51 stop:350 length:300 start_codon:yes stop_codon:yes gene_type:complete
MKTFRDLKFRPQKFDKKCIGASLEVHPDVIISIVAGPGLYSSPGGIGVDREVWDDFPDSNEFSSFEVAIINENLPDGEQEWDVKGWQSREDINALLSNY